MSDEPLKVLFCWEDKNYEGLDRAFCRFRKSYGLQNDHFHFAEMIAFSRSVYGNSNFNKYVERDWPRAKRKGIFDPKSNGSIDYLLCIADADKAFDCCSIERFNAKSDNLANWLLKANESWTKKLRSKTDVSPENIFGCFLLWDRESIVISCYDQEPVVEALSRSAQSKVPAVKI